MANQNCRGQSPDLRVAGDVEAALGLASAGQAAANVGQVGCVLVNSALGISCIGKVLAHIAAQALDLQAHSTFCQQGSTSKMQSKLLLLSSFHCNCPVRRHPTKPITPKPTQHCCWETFEGHATASISTFTDFSSTMRACDVQANGPTVQGVQQRHSCSSARDNAHRVLGILGQVLRVSIALEGVGQVGDV